MLTPFLFPSSSYTCAATAAALILCFNSPLMCVCLYLSRMMCVIVPHPFCLSWVRACFSCVCVRVCVYPFDFNEGDLDYCSWLFCFSLVASGKTRAREWLARTVDFLITFSSSCWTVSLEDKPHTYIHQGVALFLYQFKIISILTYSAFGFSFCVVFLNLFRLVFLVCLSPCCFLNPGWFAFPLDCRSFS